MKQPENDLPTQPSLDKPNGLPAQLSTQCYCVTLEDHRITIQVLVDHAIDLVLKQDHTLRFRSASIPLATPPLPVREPSRVVAEGALRAVYEIADTHPEIRGHRKLVANLATLGDFIRPTAPVREDDANAAIPKSVQSFLTIFVCDECGEKYDVDAPSDCAKCGNAKFTAYIPKSVAAALSRSPREDKGREATGTYDCPQCGFGRPHHHVCLACGGDGDVEPFGSDCSLAQIHGFPVPQGRYIAALSRSRPAGTMSEEAEEVTKEMDDNGECEFCDGTGIAKDIPIDMLATKGPFWHATEASEGETPNALMLVKVAAQRPAGTRENREES